MEPGVWILWIGLLFVMCMAMATALQRPTLATVAGVFAALTLIVYAVFAATAGEYIGTVLTVAAAGGMVWVAILINYPLYRWFFRRLHPKGRAAARSASND
ncbi:hypothetical protein SAMN04489765_0154 [Tsukamurella pulmonis]|uniref:Uncharacterized protein n=2 Tax=Tsukamurella pulmonis TaxID=47312 RepID=A0A1H1ACF2_9ACTN|nr:hypothetical protein SAMN04489765_0154 [Tsukamurella pulmonis]SUQ39382.1 Uncharacterised protein [Tsukamurella pulmonis]